MPTKIDADSFAATISSLGGPDTTAFLMGVASRCAKRSWSYWEGGRFGTGLVVCHDGKPIRIELPSGKRPSRPAMGKEGGPAAQLAAQLAEGFAAGADLRHLLADWPADQTPFQLAVLKACHAIPRGQVLSYAALADAAGFPGCARAAGTVMARNPLPLVIPCHRVVTSGGKVGNYGGGAAMKQWLLEKEKE